MSAALSFFLLISLFIGSLSFAVPPEGPHLSLVKTMPSASNSSSMPIQMKRIRTLEVHDGTVPGFPGYVSAASGLVQAHNSFYVAVDDELSMAIFPQLASQDPGRLYPLFPGTLPADHKERKKKKPDLEALTFLGTEHFSPAGAILAFPSGSKANRIHGALMVFQEKGALPAQPKPVSFQKLYAKLLETFPELNIEGATSVGNVLKLFQRGNGALGQNATIDLDLPGIVEDLKSGNGLNPKRILQIRSHDLGSIRDVRLSFTDAYSSPSVGTWFLAAAESADSTFDDGEYKGSVIGKLDAQGEVILSSVKELGIQYKPEGLWIDAESSERSFYVVTDADDSARPAEMYQGTLPLIE